MKVDDDGTLHVEKEDLNLLGTYTVTFDTHGEHPRVSTGKSVSDHMDMQRGDMAEMYALNDRFMLVRFCRTPSD